MRFSTTSALCFWNLRKLADKFWHGLLSGSPSEIEGSQTAIRGHLHGCLVQALISDNRSPGQRFCKRQVAQEPPILHGGNRMHKSPAVSESASLFSLESVYSKPRLSHFSMSSRVPLFSSNHGSGRSEVFFEDCHHLERTPLPRPWLFERG